MSFAQQQQQHKSLQFWRDAFIKAEKEEWFKVKHARTTMHVIKKRGFVVTNASLLKGALGISGPRSTYKAKLEFYSCDTSTNPIVEIKVSIKSDGLCKDLLALGIFTDNPDKEFIRQTTKFFSVNCLRPPEGHGPETKEPLISQGDGFEPGDLGIEHPLAHGTVEAHGTVCQVVGPVPTETPAPIEYGKQ